MLLIHILKIIWALPNTALGVFIGLVSLCLGARIRWRFPLEFYGGKIANYLTNSRHGEFALAMTLGHVILGRSLAALDISHEHEMVHVRQYERWGPFFLPAYFGWMLYLKLKGKDPYRDNPFEREAYGE
ncbi:MAG: hypothetical protein R3C11_24980 [Planctomycetaceae bacterium]